MIRNSHVNSMDINTLEKIRKKESFNEYNIIIIQTTELQNKYTVICYLGKNMH